MTMIEADRIKCFCFLIWPQITTQPNSSSAEPSLVHRPSLRGAGEKRSGEDEAKLTLRHHSASDISSQLIFRNNAGHAISFNNTLNKYIQITDPSYSAHLLAGSICHQLRNPLGGAVWCDLALVLYLHDCTSITPPTCARDKAIGLCVCQHKNRQIWSVGKVRKLGQCKSWTVDYGLDCGLDRGPKRACANAKIPLPHVHSRPWHIMLA